jgi:hypothetical protein
MSSWLQTETPVGATRCIRDGETDTVHFRYPLPPAVTITRPNTFSPLCLFPLWPHSLSLPVSYTAGCSNWNLSLQPAAHTCSLLADYSTLKMEAIRSSETSIYQSSTQRHIPEVQVQTLENFKERKSHSYHNDESAMTE